MPATESVTRHQHHPRTCWETHLILVTKYKTSSIFPSESGNFFLLGNSFHVFRALSLVRLEVALTGLTNSSQDGEVKLLDGLDWLNQTQLFSSYFFIKDKTERDQWDGVYNWQVYLVSCRFIISHRTVGGKFLNICGRTVGRDYVMYNEQSRLEIT